MPMQVFCIIEQRYYRMTYYVTISISHPTGFRTFFLLKGILEDLSVQIDSVSCFLSSKLSLPQHGAIKRFLRDFSKQDLWITKPDL